MRERELRDLVRRRRTPVALVDEAHELHAKTLVGLKRLVEVVREADAMMAIVLIGHPSLVVGLRRPAMEEIGARTTVLDLVGIRGQEREFIDWMLRHCVAKDVGVPVATEQKTTIFRQEHSGGCTHPGPVQELYCSLQSKIDVSAKPLKA